MRIQFYIDDNTYNTTSKYFNNITRTWLNTTRCEDFYAERMDPQSPTYDASIAREFGVTGWICPDIESYEVNNDPWLYREGPGKNLVMVVNKCSHAL